MRKLKQMIKANKFLNAVIVSSYRQIKKLLKIPKDIKLYFGTKKALQSPRVSPRIFYLGMPVHNNLGDLAQGVCIRKWIKKHFSGYEVIEIETNAIVNTTCSVLNLLKRAYSEEDIIIFQSGYTTTDLGGYADEMHCAVIKSLPKAKFLMMPQTIFFEKEERKKRTSLVYNSAKNMLFLARDKVSDNMAKEMFPDISVQLFPDIVTTLIGQYTYDNSRNGILFCCRDDSEKYYSDDDIAKLMESCSKFADVERTDTTKKVKSSKIVKRAKEYVLSEIENYSKYNLIITDRYHGTIFSLVAGTPVIIIKSTDHKVTTGADWFKGVYDDHVYLANSLEHAYELAERIYSEGRSHSMNCYFENEFYDKLKNIFESLTQK